MEVATVIVSVLALLFSLGAGYLLYGCFILNSWKNEDKIPFEILNELGKPQATAGFLFKVSSEVMDDTPVPNHVPQKLVKLSWELKPSISNKGTKLLMFRKLEGASEYDRKGIICPEKGNKLDPVESGRTYHYRFELEVPFPVNFFGALPLKSNLSDSVEFFVVVPKPENKIETIQLDIQIKTLEKRRDSIVMATDPDTELFDAAIKRLNLDLKNKMQRRDLLQEWLQQIGTSSLSAPEKRRRKTVVEDTFAQFESDEATRLRLRR